MSTDQDTGAPSPDADADELHRERLEIESGAAERMTFFSDAVIAIAMTLLALELPVPHDISEALTSLQQNREVLHELNENSSEYIAFLISFAVVGSHWFGHHRLFRYLGRLGGSLARLNMLWLLTVIINPFATKLIIGNGGFLVRFGIYAMIQTIASVLFLLMVLQMRKHRLLRPSAPANLLPAEIRRASAMAAVFFVSIPLAMLGNKAFLVWIFLPFVIRLVAKLWFRRHPERRAPDDIAS